MKKYVTILGLLFFSVVGFSQNVFNTAAGTFVGIGTTSPLVRLDVRAPANTIATTDLAFFGNVPIVGNSRGLYVKNRYSLSTGNGTILQYISGPSTVTTSNKGFIEFNNPATTNTTISAVSFGSNAVEYMRINQDGKVRIGSGASDIQTPAGYKLFVEEGILTEKLKVSVKNGSNWSDYVFNKDYNLMALDEVEHYVLANKHLPNVPSAAEMVENGLDVATMDAKLLEKIEELTLYIIEQNKRNDDQNKEIEELKVLVKILMEKK